MLSREYRLPATIRFSHSRYNKTTFFSIKYARSTAPVSRFAFIVRKTVDKRSVIRNRIRRVFRSCIEELLGEIVPGYDMLFFLEKGIIDNTREEMLKEISRTLEKSGLLPAKKKQP